MNIAQSFKYIFQDKDWLGKVLIGSLIVLVSFPLTIILVGFLGLAIVAGYSLEVLRNVRQGSAKPLPEWRDRWSEWMVLGLKAMLVLLAWSLPGLLLQFPATVGNNLVYSGNDLVQVFGWMLTASAGLLSFAWSLIVLLVTPALYIRLAETEDLASAFRFQEIISFTRRNLSDVIIAVLIALVAGVAITLVGWMVGALLCLIGLAITVPAAYFISTLISSHLYAQIGMGRQESAAQPIVPEVVPPANVKKGG
jgi:hypothetical protein